MDPGIYSAQLLQDISTSCSTPDSYRLDRRESPTSDALSYLYGEANAPGDQIPWSYFSIDDTVPFTDMLSMQLDQTYDSCEPSVDDVSGCYTTQQINDWFLGRESARSLYESTISNRTGPTFGHVPTDMGQEMRLAFDDSPPTAMQQCLSPLPTMSFAYDSSLAFSPPLTAASLDTSTSSISSPPVLSDAEASSPHHSISSPPVSACNQVTQYGTPVGDGLWRCAHPGCTSEARFRRGCDLRKHFNKHRKHLLCRHNCCPQSKQGGFSNKKDRDRHEAKHNPRIICEWDLCGRVFSRVDNMKDHVRRVHRRIGKNR
ncbi:hypothetical protein NUU61_003911 [Penicillium alfredii]|uniref:C2H2-type domain-containing protein n=1 Tax=Penicillium alfredii TaxID=1506179 RepID=A0A9W9FKB8_9EURO|nr:uncharacterized protein NUU61_003911 [Penicillium alfredii]KAJ5101689.1 hypothetical protein NUU61_003911 [Penicillium alfredii]